MLLDIGIGIVGAIIFSFLTETELDRLILFWSVFFSLIPDLDAVYKLIDHRSFKKIDHTHRDIFHYPFLFIGVGFIIFSLLLDYRYGLLFATLSFVHFVHDSVGIGWGIQWLYPFSNNYYKYHDGKHQWWTPQQQKEISARNHDPNWMKNIYFKLTPTLLLEVGIIALALILLSIAKK